VSPIPSMSPTSSSSAHSSSFYSPRTSSSKSTRGDPRGDICSPISYQSKSTHTPKGSAPQESSTPQSSLETSSPLLSTSTDVSQFNPDFRIPGHLDNPDISGCSDNPDLFGFMDNPDIRNRRFSILRLSHDLSPLVSTVTSMGSRSEENRSNSPRALRLKADNVITYPINI
jgi:hypothetical protein